MRAVERALDGKPSLDVLNYRTGRSGGRLALRSHFVPFQAPVNGGRTRRAVMVMDTIASVRERLEALNARIRDVNRKSWTGPPTALGPLEVEEWIRRWRRARRR